MRATDEVQTHFVRGLDAESNAVRCEANHHATHEAIIVRKNNKGQARIKDRGHQLSTSKRDQTMANLTFQAGKLTEKGKRAWDDVAVKEKMLFRAAAANDVPFCKFHGFVLARTRAGLIRWKSCTQMCNFGSGQRVTEKALPCMTQSHRCPAKCNVSSKRNGRGHKERQISQRDVSAAKTCWNRITRECAILDLVSASPKKRFRA